MVDIIVPIYNAFEFTDECIKKVIKHTNLEENNLILINDKSPDARIKDLLKEYKEKNKNINIIVLENENNLGFVKTVNRGMEYSKENDVVLLNSDTEVTNGWLEKLKKCAYSNEIIGTVTPLTNNGTICSVPNFGVDNELPDNMTLDEYAEMIEKISFSRYPELTTANGFCMYIKRKVINEVGLFDDITFEKGYGEENDFCYRAANYGYIHVLCDNTFIYHKGTQSFKKENLTETRAKLIESHMKKLREKHQIYVDKTDNFIRTNPLVDIQENIKMNTILFNKRKFLFLVNEWEENMIMTGGTSLHLKDIINGIRKNGNACFVLCPDKNDLSRMKIYLYVDDIGKEILSFKTELGMYGKFTFSNKSYKEMLEKLFEIFKFDIVHVHHLLFQTFDIAGVAKKNNAYLIMTLHDLYMICPSVNMLKDSKFCNQLKEVNNLKMCESCIKNRFGISENIIKKWRNECEKLLNKCDKIITPSENTKQLYLKAYSNLKIDVIEHGVEYRSVKENNKNNKKIFNISFVGAMAEHKGMYILKQIIKSDKLNKNIKINLIGKANNKYLEQNRKNYIFRGAYNRGDLPNKLVENNIDLVCIFAVWPETYSYTLTETYMAKIPVMSYDIGAVGDRIKKDKTGWVISIDSSVDEIIEKINKISTNVEEYEKIKDNFEKYEFKDLVEMQKEYEKIYSDIKGSKDYIDAKLFYNEKSKTENIDLKILNNEMRRFEILAKIIRKIKRTKIGKVLLKIKRKIENWKS